MSSTSFASETQPSPKKSAYIQEKEKLIDFQVIMSDLENFSCRCRPMCLSPADATFVGQVRNTVLKLGSRSKVFQNIYQISIFLMILCCRSNSGGSTQCVLGRFRTPISQRLQNGSIIAVTPFVCTLFRSWLLDYPKVIGRPVSPTQWLKS